MKRYPLGLACAVIVAGGVPALASGSGISRALPAPAVPGDLDVTFSGDGRQITDFGGSDGATAVAVQADGKIVVAGSSAGDFALARYGADGTPDASFSGDGFVTTDLGGTDGGQDVAVQADGKIVVAGSSGGNFALARYSAGGVLDTSFSGDGLQTTDFGAADGGTAMAVQADGRIVVGGNSGGNFALARYDANGGLDTSFSGDGKQTTDFGGFDSSNDVAIGADGAIVAVGTHAFGDLRAANFALARYSAGGALVSVQTTDFGHSQSTYDSGEGVAIQADGHIVVVGYGQEQDQFGGYYPRDLQLARYDVSGALDSTFSDDGRLATSFGADSLGYGVALEGNGRIVAIGKAAGAFTLARFNTDGTLDATFSDDGKQTSDAALAGADEVGVDGVLQADGKLVTVGTAAGAGGSDFVLARFHGDAPDPDPPGPNTPETRITGGPSGPTNVTAPSYRFTATLAGSTFECKVDGPGAAMGTYTSCASPKAYGTLTDGRYTFSVRATRSGITDPTPATRPFTVDTIGPGLIFDSVPPPYTNNPFARLEFHSTEPNSTFVCGSTWSRFRPTTSGHAFRRGHTARSVESPCTTSSSSSRTRRGTRRGTGSPGVGRSTSDPPSAAILSGPSGTTQATTASFEFISSEDGTFECKLDGPGTATGTYASCASPKTYSGLGAGAYTFLMRSIDLAGNGSSPETRSFTVAPNPTPTSTPRRVRRHHRRVRPSPSPSPTPSPSPSPSPTYPVTVAVAEPDGLRGDQRHRRGDPRSVDRGIADHRLGLCGQRVSVGHGRGAHRAHVHR